MSARVLVLLLSIAGTRVAFSHVHVDFGYIGTSSTIVNVSLRWPFTVRNQSGFTSSYRVRLESAGYEVWGYIQGFDCVWTNPLVSVVNGQDLVTTPGGSFTLRTRGNQVERDHARSWEFLVFLDRQVSESWGTEYYPVDFARVTLSAEVLAGGTAGTPVVTGAFDFPVLVDRGQLLQPVRLSWQLENEDSTVVELRQGGEVAHRWISPPGGRWVRDVVFLREGLLASLSSNVDVSSGSGSIVPAQDVTLAWHAVLEVDGLPDDGGWPGSGGGGGPSDLDFTAAVDSVVQLSGVAFALGAAGVVVLALESLFRLRWS